MNANSPCSMENDTPLSASWPPEVLGWGPLYEPLRVPSGAEAGRRLLMRAISLPLTLGLLEFGLAGVVLAGVWLAGRR
mgnify:CR=1 FL=1